MQSYLYREVVRRYTGIYLCYKILNAENAKIKNGLPNSFQPVSRPYENFSELTNFFSSKTKPLLPFIHPSNSLPYLNNNDGKILSPWRPYAGIRNSLQIRIWWLGWCHGYLGVAASIYPQEYTLSSLFVHTSPHFKVS